jgi:hypothetical protein
MSFPVNDFSRRLLYYLVHFVHGLACSDCLNCCSFENAFSGCYHFVSNDDECALTKLVIQPCVETVSLEQLCTALLALQFNKF